MRRMGLASVALAVAFLTMVVSARAEATTKICVPEASSVQVLSTNTKGECPTKTISKKVVNYKPEALPGTAELEKLDKILPHINYVESGVGGKPTIQFSGVNVQVVSGAGKTNAAVNGEGNLVIGYDENKEGKHTQTGSHDLILGEEQTFTSFGGIVAGLENTISGPSASVSGGSLNTASGEQSSVGGGFFNKASGLVTVVSGGSNNTASIKEASVSGGFRNEASGEHASVSGGYKNTAGFAFSSIFGGKELATKAEYEAIP
jgi:hypothetical protein